MKRVLVIDNYDSFVYNLVQYLGELGAEPLVHRHDALTLDEIDELDPDGILISPGPGRPEDAGLSREVVATTPVTRTVEGDLGMRWSAVATTVRRTSPRRWKAVQVMGLSSRVSGPSMRIGAGAHIPWVRTQSTSPYRGYDKF